MSVDSLMVLLWHTVKIAAPICLLWLILRYIFVYLPARREKRKLDATRELAVNIFAVYLIFLFTITVFRYGIHPERWLSRPDLFSTVNLRPFVHTIKLYYASTKWYIIYNMLGNILWFVPFGMLFPLCGRKKRGFFFTVLCGALCSLSIEVLQLVCNTGISDIDDIIFNTTGTIVGVLLCMAVLGILKMRKKRKSQ